MELRKENYADKECKREGEEKKEVHGFVPRPESTPMPAPVQMSSAPPSSSAAAHLRMSSSVVTSSSVVMVRLCVFLD